MQQQCPWCGRLGPRYSEVPQREGLTAADMRWADLHEPGWDRSRPAPDWAAPHADGSRCVCRHVTCSAREQAVRLGGRYWDGERWACPTCDALPGQSGTSDE